MLLKLGIKHQAIELYKVYINHNLGMTLTYFMARPTKIAYAFEWRKLVKCNSIGGNLLGDVQMDRIFMFMKISWAQRVVCPCPGAIYMCMTIIFKHLLL